MVRDSEGTYEAVDFREAAPAAGHEDMYQGNVPGSIYGGLAVGVPSEVLGLEYIHSKYGVCSISHFPIMFMFMFLLLTRPCSHYHGRQSCKALFMWPATASGVYISDAPMPKVYGNNWLLTNKFSSFKRFSRLRRARCQGEAQFFGGGS